MLWESGRRHNDETSEGARHNHFSASEKNSAAQLSPAFFDTAVTQFPEPKNRLDLGFNIV